MKAATHLKGSKYETTVEWSSRSCKEDFTHKCHLKHQQVIISIRVNKDFIRDPHLVWQAYNLPATVGCHLLISPLEATAPTKTLRPMTRSCLVLPTYIHQICQALDLSISSSPLPQLNTSVGGRNKVIQGSKTKHNQHLRSRLHSNKAS